MSSCFHLFWALPRSGISGSYGDFVTFRYLYCNEQLLLDYNQLNMRMLKLREAKKVKSPNGVANLGTANIPGPRAGASAARHLGCKI